MTFALRFGPTQICRHQYRSNSELSSEAQLHEASNLSPNYMSIERPAKKVANRKLRISESIPKIERIIANKSSSCGWNCLLLSDLISSIKCINKSKSRISVVLTLGHWDNPKSGFPTEKSTLMSAANKFASHWKIDSIAVCDALSMHPRCNNSVKTQK